MNEVEMKEQTQRANDMLEMIQNQRNAAQNECVALAAQLKAAQRRVKELEDKLAPLEKPVMTKNGAVEEAVVMN